MYYVVMYCSSPGGAARRAASCGARCTATPTRSLGRARASPRGAAAGPPRAVSESPLGSDDRVQPDTSTRRVTARAGRRGAGRGRGVRFAHCGASMRTMECMESHGPARSAASTKLSAAAQQVRRGACATPARAATRRRFVARRRSWSASRASPSAARRRTVSPVARRRCTLTTVTAYSSPADIIGGRLLHVSGRADRNRTGAALANESSGHHAPARASGPLSLGPLRRAPSK